MALSTARVSVTASAVKIAENTTSPSGMEDVQTVRVLLHNKTGTEAVFLGPTGVTTATGYEWTVAHGPLSVSLEPGESLFGIIVTATQIVHTLKAGRSG